MQAFRRRYPGPTNLLVAADVVRPFERRYGELRVRFIGLGDLASVLSRREALQPSAG